MNFLINNGVKFFIILQTVMYRFLTTFSYHIKSIDLNTKKKKKKKRKTK